MTDPIILDAGPLGRIANPRPHPEIVAWVDELLRARVRIFISEVSDFEVRRNLILHDMHRSLARLDDLRGIFDYLPITTSVMRKAADLWAASRRRGRPTADSKELDCDGILAAQAIEINAIIATETVGHLAQFVTARLWQRITPR